MFTLLLQSFLIIATILNTLSVFTGLMTLYLFPPMGDAFNYVPAGPIALVWSIVYQYLQLVPNAYQFRVFGVELNDKIWVYALAGLVSLLSTTSAFTRHNNLPVNDPCVTGIVGLVECAFSPLTHSCWSPDRVHLSVRHSTVEGLANSPKVCVWRL